MIAQLKHARSVHDPRAYQEAIRLFCSLPAIRITVGPGLRAAVRSSSVAGLFEWNTAVHAQDNESAPDPAALHQGRAAGSSTTPTTRSNGSRRRGRKGWLPAYRDAVAVQDRLLRRVCARNEVTHLQTVDFARNPPRANSASTGSCRSGTARPAGLPTQATQRPDGLRLVRRGPRRLARNTAPCMHRRHRTSSPPNGRAGARIHPAPPVPPLLRRDCGCPPRPGHPLAAPLLRHPPHRGRLGPHIRPAPGRPRTRLDHRPLHLVSSDYRAPH